jgi:hypothetical protein
VHNLLIFFDDLPLVEKYLFPFLGDDETIAFARVEPLYLSLLLGQWAYFHETGRA